MHSWSGRDHPFLVDADYAGLVLVEVVQALPVEFAVGAGEKGPGGPSPRQVVLHTLLVR